MSETNDPDQVKFLDQDSLLASATTTKFFNDNQISRYEIPYPDASSLGHPKLATVYVPFTPDHSDNTWVLKVERLFKQWMQSQSTKGYGDVDRGNEGSMKLYTVISLSHMTSKRVKKFFGRIVEKAWLETGADEKWFIRNTLEKLAATEAAKKMKYIPGHSDDNPPKEVQGTLTFSEGLSTLAQKIPPFTEDLCEKPDGDDSKEQEKKDKEIKLFRNPFYKMTLARLLMLLYTHPPGGGALNAQWQMHVWRLVAQLLSLLLQNHTWMVTFGGILLQHAMTPRRPGPTGEGTAAGNAAGGGGNGPPGGDPPGGPVANIVDRAWGYARRHPWKMAMHVGLTVGPMLLFPALGVLGFGARGVAAGSLAAFWQSTMGGRIVAGSLFALCQSAAMGGAAAATFTQVAMVASAVGSSALWLSDYTDGENPDGVRFVVETVILVV